MKRLLAAIIAVLLLAACGSTHIITQTVTRTVTRPAPTTAIAPSSECPAGQSYMGCGTAMTTTANNLFKALPVPHGELVPDVSDWQGAHINWAAVRAWQRAHGWTLQGAMIKLGEYTIDPDALINARALHRLGMIAVGYVFVRPGISASTVIGWAKAAGVHLVILDEEVPSIQGEAARLAPALRRAGFKVGDYHSAGQTFDTSARGLPCDVAAYGPASPPACSTGPRIGWQMTDGHYGIPVSVPGIGLGDVNVSYGLLRLGVRPKPAHCWGKHSHPKSKVCRAIRSQYARDVVNGKHWWAEARKVRKAHS